MTFLEQLSDDQLALLGCGGALLLAFTVMTLSYHVGRLTRRPSMSHTRSAITSDTEKSQTPVRRAA